MRSTIKKTVMTLVVLGTLLSGQIAYAAQISSPQGIREQTTDSAVAPAAMYEDVLANYSSYTCPNGYSSHKIAKFDADNKRIYFQTGYREVSPVLSGEWRASMCGCSGLGTVRRYQCRYSTW